MKATCTDQEEALRGDDPALAEAWRRHADGCGACGEERRAWDALSEAAPALRKEWPSPDLRDRIRGALLAEARPARRVRPWAWASLAAAASVALALVALRSRPFPSMPSAGGIEVAEVPPPAIDEGRRLLTEQALAEVEKAEEAYVRSIGALSRLAEAQLQQRSPILANYREKLLVLDTAIADCRAQVERNRFNAHLRLELLAAYREKQQTLESLLKEDPHAL